MDSPGEGRYYCISEKDWTQRLTDVSILQQEAAQVQIYAILLSRKLDILLEKLMELTNRCEDDNAPETLADVDQQDKAEHI